METRRSAPREFSFVRNGLARIGLTALTLAALAVGCVSSIPGPRAPALAKARTVPASTSGESADRPAPDYDRANETAKPWHLEIGFRDSHTKLAETKRLLDRRLEIPLKYDVLNVFHHPDTPLDRKSNLTLTSFYLGAGRQESDWFVWNLYLGGGGAGDHTHQRFLNANLEVDFHYALIYTNLTAEIYPWHVPHPTDGMDWSQRLSASRPYVVTGVETGYVSADGRGHYSLAPLRVYADKAIVRDWITSYILGLGWAVPLDAHWSVNLTGDYRFHFYRPDEYDSWVFSAGLRYNF